ncbi:helix-turn-helix domain-containing protein [Nonomuraea ceibae]|uniref:helix-turn-helix domain-containing protein n=1 Tax=Nonomuraea ceibae TaxID=1935170 RepID=UPI001C6051A8|nr:helix-turn-helix domain-containing protein [Nonomuraea ceibae]
MTQTAHEAEAVEEIDELDCLKPETLADRWEVSKRTIERLMYSGELRSIQIGGWARRIRRLDAIAYLNRQIDDSSESSSGE